MKKRYPKCKQWQRVQKTSQPIRHTHATSAGIEDAIASLLYASQDLEVLSLRIEQTLRILRLVREGPHSYKMVIRKR